MQLSSVIPFGRSFDEYSQMFGLGEADRQRRILGVGDGPASFNAEATRRGWNVTSVDPIYQFSVHEIESRFHASIDTVIDQVLATPDNWVWTYHQSPEALRTHRTEVIAEFSEDFAAATERNRYVTGALPRLPFADGSFDIALCSHLLFLYSDLLDLEFHISSLTEMLRVAGEARVFPLLNLDLARSRHLEGVLDHFSRQGIAATVQRMPYELQKGGNEALILLRGVASTPGLARAGA